VSKHEARGRRTGHKDLQVCRQVFDALSLTLADCDEPALDDIVLVSVMPAPDAGRLLVMLAPGHANVDLDAARQALAELAPELRAEVASEITRRHAPELVFVVEPLAPRTGDQGPNAA
jgi:hypothetical protein